MSDPNVQVSERMPEYEDISGLRQLAAKKKKFARVWLAASGTPSVGPESQMASFEVHMRFTEAQGKEIIGTINFLMEREKSESGEYFEIILAPTGMAGMAVPLNLKGFVE